MAENVIYEIESNGQIFEIEGPAGASTADLAPIVQQYLAQQQQQPPAQEDVVRTRQGPPGDPDVPTDIPQDLGQGGARPPAGTFRGRLDQLDEAFLQSSEVAADFAQFAVRNFNRGLGKATFTTPIMDMMGIGQEAEGDGIAARGFEAVGEAAGLGTVATAAARAAVQGLQAGCRLIGAQSMLEGLLSRFFQTAVKNPAAVTAAESAAAFAGGALGETLDSKGESPAARFAGELIGSVTPGGAVAAGRGAMKYSPLAQGLRSMVRMSQDPIKNRTALDAAASRLQRAIPGGRLALAGGDADLIPEAREVMSTAERTGNNQLLGIERYLMGRSPDLAEQGTTRLREVQNLIRQSARTAATGGGEAGRVDPDVAREYLDGLVQTALEEARKELNDTLQVMPENISRRDLSLQARSLLDNARRAARLTETELWGAVPNSIRTTSTRATDATKRILDDIEKSRVTKDIPDLQLPPQIARFLGRYQGKGKNRRFIPGVFAKGTGASVRELQDLRSFLGRQTQEELGKAAPNQNYVRILTQISDGLLEDISNVPEADEALTVARNFSRDLNDRFTRGVIGKTLGYDRSGTEMVSDALTLEKLIGTGTSRDVEEKGRALIEAVSLKASGRDNPVGDPAEMQRLMSDFLLDEFRRQAVPDGEFNPGRARTYLRNRQDILRQFPNVDAGIRRAIEAGDAAAAGQRRYSPSQSAAGVVIGAPPGKEAARLFRSPKAAEATDATMKMLADSPEATLGFQQGVIDEVLKGVFSFDDIRGRTLAQRLDDPNVRRVLDRALTREQRGRLNQIKQTALRLDQIREARPRPDVAIEESLLGQLARRFTAAAAGRKAGQLAGSGGTVQIPQAFVGLSEKLMDRGMDPARELVKRAVLEDDQLLRALLSRRVSDLAPQDEAFQMLNVFAYKAASDYGIDLAEEARQDAQQENRRERQRPVGVE